MYAIVKTGGKQYRVERGQRLLVERLPAEEGSSVALQPILFRSEEAVLDKAGLERVEVTARVIAHERGQKLRVFKFKPKRGYKRRNGHRQALTRIEVTGLGLKAVARETSRCQSRGRQGGGRQSNGRGSGQSGSGLCENSSRRESVGHRVAGEGAGRQSESSGRQSQSARTKAKASAGKTKASASKAKASAKGAQSGAAASKPRAPKAKPAADGAEKKPARKPKAGEED